MAHCSLTRWVNTLAMIVRMSPRVTTLLPASFWDTFPNKASMSEEMDACDSRSDATSVPDDVMIIKR